MLIPVERDSNGAANNQYTVLVLRCIKALDNTQQP